MVNQLNSFAVLLRLLLRQGRKPGASIDDMARALGFEGKDLAIGRILVIDYLNSLSKVLALIGLRIKYIPSLRTFTIVFKKSLEEYTADLPKEAYRTLLALIRHFVRGEEEVGLSVIARERGLSIATIRKHIHILEDRGYVHLKGQNIRKAPKLLVILDMMPGGEQ